MALNTQVSVGDLSSSLCKSYMGEIMASMNSIFGSTQTASNIARSSFVQHLKDNGTITEWVRVKNLFWDHILTFPSSKNFLVGLENGWLEGWGRFTVGGDIVYHLHSDDYTRSLCKDNTTCDPTWQQFGRDSYYTNGTWIINEFIPTKFYAPSRAWYKKSSQLKSFSLTDLYIFAGEATVGLAATEPIWDPRNSSHMVGATCIDFDMNVLSQTFSSLKVSKSGWIVLVDSQFRLVASSFPITQTVAAIDMDRLIDGEESIEPRVVMAVKALKGHGSSFAELSQKLAKGNNEITSFFNLGSHRVIYNVAEYFTLGLIPIIVVPEADFSFTIILGYGITFFFLLLVLALSVAFALGFSLFIGIPLSKIMRLMGKAKNMKLTNLKPVWYVGILYEIRRIQSNFFVMVERLREYRAFLPAEILQELDKKDHASKKRLIRAGVSNGFETETEDTQSAERSSNTNRIAPENLNDKEKSPFKGNQYTKGTAARKNSAESVFSVQKTDKSAGKKTKKLDALAIGLEVFEGYTMVSISWDNFLEFIEVVGTEEYIQIYSRLLGIVQECSKRARGVVDVKESCFEIYFPSASSKAISLAVRAMDEIREKIMHQNCGVSKDICKLIVTYAVCTDSMYVGTVGTKDCRVKTRVGACQTLNRTCQKLARLLGVDTVCCDKCFAQLKECIDFRPAGMTFLNGELRQLYVFDGRNEKTEDAEWMYKMELEHKEQIKKDFSLGFEALTRAEFEEATKHFEAFLETINSNDQLTKYLLEKTKKFAERELDAEAVKNELSV